MNYRAMLEDYAEFLTWSDLEKILGKHRVTLNRWRLRGTLAGVEFIETPAGEKMATKESVIGYLERAAAQYQTSTEQEQKALS
jgi:hypothetical protein